MKMHNHTIKRRDRETELQLGIIHYLRGLGYAVGKTKSASAAALDLKVANSIVAKIKEKM